MTTSLGFPVAPTSTTPGVATVRYSAYVPLAMLMTVGSAAVPGLAAASAAPIVGKWVASGVAFGSTVRSVTRGAATAVTLTGALAADVAPARFTAWTVYRYAAPGVTVESV